jgi:hypothetical protein
MSREMVQTAVKLLAKAQSTTSDYEAIALVERSYALLAQVITAYDLENDTVGGASRRRERRRLRERRRRAHSDATDGIADRSGSEVRTGESIARYRRSAGDSGSPWRRGIDVKL